MGRPRKPSKILKMQGTHRPHRRRNEPEPAPCEPKCPAWLSAAAKKEWKRIVKDLVSLGIVAELDATILALYCQACADYLAAQKVVQNLESLVVTSERGNIIEHPAVRTMRAAWDQVIKGAREFGLTPSARSGLNTEKTTGKTVKDFAKSKPA